MRSLPVIQPSSPRFEPSEGSLGRDGRRRRPYPADVSGRFARARRVMYWLLILLWAALPWIRIHGHPAVFLDVDRRQFFLFGGTFNAQDVWLAFFALTGVGFALVFVTALLGRAWCGWACPQTVFLEGVFRPIERFVNGSRSTYLRRKEHGGIDHVWRVVLTHAAYLVAAFLIAHIVLAYFASLPQVFAMVRSRPTAHPEAFAWAAAVTAVLYGNFAFFREQLCVVVCPYGRLQSVLIDDDSLVVGYDERRGEPRGKAKSGGGDCVDCHRCVVVCPTGIDIRQGLQLDCIACTACIDACDDVMDRLERPRGLIRYDSLRSLRGEARRFLRPRIWVYAAMTLLGAGAATIALRRHSPFEANIVRLAGMPYTREGETLRNAFELHVVNKRSDSVRFTLEPVPGDDLAFVVPLNDVTVEPLGGRRLPVFVTMDRARFAGDRAFDIVVRTQAGDTSSAQRVHAVFLGAK